MMSLAAAVDIPVGVNAAIGIGVSCMLVVFLFLFGVKAYRHYQLSKSSVTVVGPSDATPMTAISNPLGYHTQN